MKLGTWLKNEFKGIFQPPTVNYNATYPISLVSGSEPICNPATYKVNNLPAGASVIWSVDPQSIATVNSATGTVTGKASGTAILTATITSCGLTFPTQKTIQVGVPTVNISYSQNGTCNSAGYQTWSLNATSPNTITSWQWTVDNPSSGSWYINSPNSASTMVDVSGGGGISVTATSSCGTTKTGVTIYSNCPHIVITATPNPTANNVTVAVKEQKNALYGNKQKAMMYQIKVTDQSGNVKKQYKYSSGTANTSISLNGLISGLYTIQAFDGTSWSSVRVIKQ